MHRATRWIAGAAVAVVFAGWAWTNGARGDESTRVAMREIVAQLRVLLPDAVQHRFDDPARADAIRQALGALEERAETLDIDGAGLDPGARLFGQALARDARRARELFERGRTENAAFYVESLVDDCVACHTRSPAADSAWPADFLREPDLQSLDPLERAIALVATRQFSEALDTYEAVFRDPSEGPALLTGPLADALGVALRVRRDPARARSLVEILLERPSLPSALRADLEHWRERLATLSSADLAGTTLERARKAVAEGDAAGTSPGDRRALIEYLIASAQLSDLLPEPQASPLDAAEVYLLLGRAELGIGPAGWLPRADLYLETAIRLAPGSVVARDAFAILQEEVIAGYTGSGGLRLPPDEETRLRSLRKLAGVTPLDDVEDPVEAYRADALDSSRQLDLAERGSRLFSDHCAFCHGSDATGDGPAAPTLMTPPKDLTRIEERRGGEFPSAEVRALVDGRDPAGAHRSPEMPRWGAFWAEPDKLDAVVAYLRQIQR